MVLAFSSSTWTCTSGVSLSPDFMSYVHSLRSMDVVPQLLIRLTDSESDSVSFDRRSLESEDLLLTHELRKQGHWISCLELTSSLSSLLTHKLYEDKMSFTRLISEIAMPLLTAI